MTRRFITMPGRPSDRHRVKVALRKAGLSTVCEEARCPNIAECFGRHTATFLILGDSCTRSCGFCGIDHDKTPKAPDPLEPVRLAQAVLDLGLAHAVLTSVTRDDLGDGGASHFAACIGEIKNRCPGVSVEVLIPDFQGSGDALGIVLAAGPQVLNHNVECAPRLYPLVRPQADYQRSLELLARAARQKGVTVKSGMMVGIGEDDQEVLDVLSDLKAHGCQLVTIGQYLRPSKEQLPLARHVEDSSFNTYVEQGRRLGLRVVAGALVRSSYCAAEVYADRMGEVVSDTGANPGDTVV